MIEFLALLTGAVVLIVIWSARSVRRNATPARQARPAKTGTGLQRRYNSKNPRAKGHDEFALKAVGTSHH